jgi:hypothetical protein
MDESIRDKVRIDRGKDKGKLIKRITKVTLKRCFPLLSKRK